MIVEFLGQPDLQCKFQVNQGYTERLSNKQPNIEDQKKNSFMGKKQ